MKIIKTTIVTLIRILSCVVLFVCIYSYNGDINYIWEAVYVLVTQVIIPGLIWYCMGEETPEIQYDGELHISVADDEGTIWRLSIPDEVAKVIEEKDVLTIKVDK